MCPPLLNMLLSKLCTQWRPLLIISTSTSYIILEYDISLEKFQVSWVTKATYCNPFLPLSISRQTKTWFWQRVGLYQINEKCLPCLYDLLFFWMRFQEGGSLGKGISKLTSTKLSVSWPVGQWFWVLSDGKIGHIVNNKGGVLCNIKVLKHAIETKHYILHIFMYLFSFE